MRIPRSVGPIPVGTAVEPRRIVELILSNADPVAAQPGIVLEARPGHGEVVLTHSEEAAKRYDGVSDLAADLVEHYPLNGSDLIVIPAVYRRPFHLIAADQTHSLSPIVYSRRSHCLGPPSGVKARVSAPLVGTFILIVRSVRWISDQRNAEVPRGGPKHHFLGTSCARHGRAYPFGSRHPEKNQ